MGIVTVLFIINFSISVFALSLSLPDEEPLFPSTLENMRNLSPLSVGLRIMEYLEDLNLFLVIS